MNMSGFDLNLLRVLDALLREGSMVKAGARVGLSQPAVSAALGRLRHALKDDLFVRQGKGLEPTDFARSLAIPLRGILDDLETLLGGPQDFDPRTSALNFTLSGSDFFAGLLMPQLADQLQKQAPGHRVQLVDFVPDSNVEQLLQHDVDIALTPMADFPDWIDVQPVFWSPFSVIARARHPAFVQAGLRRGDVMPMDLFCDLAHVLFSPEGNRTGRGDAALERVGRKRRVVMTLPVFSGVYHAVAESDLIALLPHQLAQWIAPRLGLEIYAAPMPVDPVLIAMIWHKRSSATPAHRWMRDLIASLLTPLNAGYGSLDI